MRPPALSGNAQAAKPDDSGAEQRRSLLIGEDSGDRIDEVLGRDGVFRVTAVNRVSREGRMVAEIFLSARQNSQVWSALCSQGMPTRAPMRRAVRRLRPISRSCRRLDVQESPAICAAAILLRHVQIGAANSAGVHANENFAFLGLRNWHIGENQRICGYRRGGFQDAGFHRGTLPYPLTSQAFVRCAAAPSGFAPDAAQPTLVRHPAAKDS